MLYEVRIEVGYVILVVAIDHLKWTFIYELKAYVSGVFLKKYIEISEKVQHRARRMIQDLAGLNYC